MGETGGSPDRYDSGNESGLKKLWQAHIKLSKQAATGRMKTNSLALDAKFIESADNFN